MTDTSRDDGPTARPRVERETARAARLALTPDAAIDAAPIAGIARASSRLRGPLLVLGGLALLAFGFAAAGAVSVVREAYRWSPVAGSVATAVAVAGFALVLVGIGLELAGLARLRSVDRIRRGLGSGDPLSSVRAARAWLALVENGAALRPALDALNDPDAILPLLAAGIERDLRLRSDALARRAAIDVVAAIAAMPAPALVVPLVTWRGIRLVRQIAALHGLRPGLLGTIGLLRRTVTAATMTAVTEAAVNTAAHAVLSTPILTHLAGEMAGGAVAARRMIVLGRAASVACSPLSPDDG